MHWVALAFFTSLLYRICTSHVLKISIFGVSAALAGYRKKVQEWHKRSIADLTVELSIKFQSCASVLPQTALPKQIYPNIIKWRYQVLDNTHREGLCVSCYQPEFIFHKFQNYLGIQFNIFKMVTFLQNTEIQRKYKPFHCLFIRTQVNLARFLVKSTGIAQSYGSINPTRITAFFFYLCISC